MRFHCTILTLAFAAVCLPAQPAGQSATQPAPKPHQLVYTTAERVPMTGLIASPPANDSSKTLFELAELHRIEETRTPQQIAQAKQDDAEEDLFLYRNVLGQAFSKSALPATALLAAHIRNDESSLVNPSKTLFHRPRPYHLDPTLKPVCKTSDDRTNYAYPSGHATSGYLAAFILVQIVPEKRDEILVRADEYAHNRLVCGVHYPSDLAASKQVAAFAVGNLLSDNLFRKELEAAKAEVRQALGLNP
jgi:acid phosphatase (class A)